MAKTQNIELKAQELASFFSSLGMLLRAGVPVNECPGILAEDMAGMPPGTAAAALEKTLAGNTVFSLAEAMRQSGYFPGHAASMFSLGEEAGRMESAADSLAEYYARQYALNQSIRSAVSGPALLLGMMAVVQLFLILFVLPVFDRAFETLGTVSGQGMQGAYLTARISLVVVGILLLLFLVALLLYHLPGGRGPFTSFVQVFPPVRRILYAISAGKLAHGLQMLLASGIPAPEALEKAGALVTHKQLIQKLPACHAAVAEGGDIGRALVEGGVFNGFEARVLLSAARSGDTEKALGSLADIYDREAQNAIDRLLAVLEPALVAVLTVAVGVILLSVMLPLVSIMNAVG